MGKVNKEEGIPIYHTDRMDNKDKFDVKTLFSEKCRKLLLSPLDNHEIDKQNKRMVTFPGFPTT